MKVSFIFCGLLVSSSLHGDLFLDQLIPKKQIIDERYYQLLPTVDKKNPDITFISSREPESMSLEDAFLNMIENASLAEIFIETGMYLGDTTKKAAQCFSCVYTIELDKKLTQQGQERFKHAKNIHIEYGDSILKLPTILKSIKGKTVIFLDAHYSMGQTAKGDSNTPILTELEKIKQSGCKNAILIIDDARMFYEPISDVKNTFIEGYPTLNDIVEAILEINTQYQCAIVYDTLIAFPASEKITVSPVVHATTMSRLYNGNNYHIDDVLKAEITIAKAPQKERDVLLDLAQRWTEKWSAHAGLSRHYNLWAGLIYLATEQYPAASAYLTDAKKRGLSDWRMDFYCALSQAEIFFDYR